MVSEMENNLLNIRNNNPYYRIITENILKHIPEDLKQIAVNTPQLPIIATDNYFIHYSIYPILSSENSDQVLQKVLDIYREYMKSEEYQSARVLTVLDNDISMIHSLSLTRYILEKIKEKIKDKLDKMRADTEKGRKQLSSISPQMKDDVDSGAHPNALMNRLLQDAQKGNKRAQKLLRDLSSTAVRDLFDKMKQQLEKQDRGLPREVKEMFEEARKTTEKAKDLKDLMSGKKAGKTGTSFEKLLDLMNEIKDVEFIDKILSFSKKLMHSIPRFTMKARTTTWHRTPIRFGYTKARKPWLALPRELAMPDDIFYSKFQKGQLHQRQYYRLSEGAYYVVIDKSGSMEGKKTIWARSVALALYRLARRKNRRYFLRFFDTEVYPIDDPIERPEEIIEHIVKVHSSGGTSIDNALLTAVRDIRQSRLSEYTNTVILITDGEDHVTVDPSRLKENNITLVAVMIEGENDTLKKLAEESGGQYLKAELDERGALKIVKIAER